MFLLNLGYRWTLQSEIAGLGGVVLLPAHNLRPRVEKRAARDGLRTFLLDPQLYLAGMDAEGRSKACARLATYPWFKVPSLEDIDSEGMKQREYESSVREVVSSSWPGSVTGDTESACLEAIRLQDQLGCTHIILPCPLVDEREDEGGTTGEWIDVGTRVAAQLDVTVPLLATVVVADSALNLAAFEASGFVESVADQVTARSEDIDGVYIVVVQKERVNHPFEGRLSAARAYLQLSRLFGEAGLGEVITNFGDLSGFVACGVGASRFATGPSAALRWMNIDGYLDAGGGRALPRFYSHRTGAEYLSESDLDPIVSAGAQRRIRDRTPYSAALMDRLRSGGSASDLPDWVESQNNYATAHKHYVSRLTTEGAQLRAIDNAEERLDRVLDWLETAEANSLFLDRRVGSVVGQRPPVDKWRDFVDGLRD